MELNFIKSGDYYIPDIQLQNPNIRLGKWGLMRKSYLRLAHPITFSDMVLTETLYEHCAEIEAAAKSRMNIILAIARELNAPTADRWYRCMFFNLRLEMEEYLRYEKAFECIVSGCPAAEGEDDEYDLDEV